VYQAGTLSGNPLAMAAGHATLSYLRNHKDVYMIMDRLAGVVVAGVAAAAHDAGVTMCHNRVGSMFTWFFAPGPVTDWTSAAKCDTEAFGRFFRAMIENGIYLPPSQFEAAFMGAAHTEGDVQQTIGAAKQAFATVHA
jgi:glutamate-1-semialdehyde 2,1-aminomutase